MKRPLLQAAIAFGTGIFAAWHIRQAFFVMIIFLVIMTVSAVGIRKKIARMKNLAFYGIFLLFGYLNYAFQYTYMLEPLQHLYEEPAAVSGYIISDCREEENLVSFEIFAGNCVIGGNEQKIERIVRVNVYGSGANMNFSPGMRLVVNGVMRKPAGARNPGGFNYQSNMFSKRIPAVMSVDTTDISPDGPAEDLHVLGFGLKVRAYIISSVEKNLSEEKAALMTAMLTGYRENLDKPVEDAFTASGLAHIMAVSGANIAFLLAPLLWLFRMLGLHRKAGAAAAIPVIIFYALITGMESSVMRASVMAIIIMAGKILDRKAELINSIGAACLLLLLVNPFMLFDTGFQLSVGATAGLGLLYNRIEGVFPKKIPEFIRETLAATLAAQAGVLPLMVIYFNRISVVSLISNLAAVPLTGIATVLGMIGVIADCISGSLGQYAGYAAEGLLHIILLIADTCASLPWAEVYARHWPFWWTALYYAVLIPAGVYGVAFFVIHKNKVVLCALIAGIVLMIQGILPGPLKVVFIDVGQGDSALILTPSGTSCLIDGGGTNSEAKTGYIGERVLVPLLMHEGIFCLDRVIVSHAHTDHMAGVISLIKIFPVKSVGLPEYPEAESDFAELIAACRLKGIPVAYYSCGDLIQLDSGTSFEIVHPVNGFKPGGENLNNTSLCGVLSYNRLNILFTGDLETEAEKKLIENSLLTDCDILKVAHHGGKNATSERFLDFVRPEVAVIGVGRNSFGHPSELVLDRLSKVGASIYSTLQKGAVIIDSDGTRYRVKPWYRDEWFTFLN